MRTLVIVNPNAASGRILKAFRQVEPLLPATLGDHRLAMTAGLGEVGEQLARAADDGFDTVLAVGGDGTNQGVVNALAGLPGHPFRFATLPMGTGRDWARTLGMPQEPADSLRWLHEATPQRVDLGRVASDGGSTVFLNVASTGLSGEVGRRVNAAKTKRPWTFLQATIGTLLGFDPPAMRVSLDGEGWYEGPAFVLAVGNGRYFGRGMMVCPDARMDDGLFDVVLVEGMGKVEVLAALPTLFKGTHILRDDVRVQRARHVRVEAVAPPLFMEVDGEPASSRQVEFEVLPAALEILSHPIS